MDNRRGSTVELYERLCSVREHPVVVAVAVVRNLAIIAGSLYLAYRVLVFDAVGLLTTLELAGGGNGVLREASVAIFAVGLKIIACSVLLTWIAFATIKTTNALSTDRQ